MLELAAHYESLGPGDAATAGFDLLACGSVQDETDGLRGGGAQFIANVIAPYGIAEPNDGVKNGTVKTVA